jgi:hypothetical protein
MLRGGTTKCEPVTSVGPRQAVADHGMTRVAVGMPAVLVPTVLAPAPGTKLWIRATSASPSIGDLHGVTKPRQDGNSVRVVFPVPDRRHACRSRAGQYDLGARPIQPRAAKRPPLAVRLTRSFGWES